MIIESIFDSGANISCVSLEIVNKLKIPIWKFKNEKLKYSTISNIHQYLGHVTVNLNIGNVTEKVNLSVLENPKYNSIIGLDLINKFKLSLNEEYQVFQ
jgi:hypothetical protein